MRVGRSLTRGPAPAIGRRRAATSERPADPSRSDCPGPLLALEVDDAVVALRRLPAHVALVDLAVHLDPRADHEVRLHGRLRLEVEVAALRPLDPPVVETAEPAVAVLVLRRVGGRDVHGHPA